MLQAKIERKIVEYKELIEQSKRMQQEYKAKVSNETLKSFMPMYDCENRNISRYEDYIEILESLLK